AVRLPKNALLAAELRLDPRLLRWLGTLDSSEKAQRDWQTFEKVSRGLLGRDLFDDVLTHVRPSLGGAVVPSENLNERSAPVEGLLAWELSVPKNAPTNAEPTAGQPTLRESLDGALLTLLNLGAVSHNSRNPESVAVPRRSQRDDTTLRWLDGLSPYRPAFGLSSEHLLLASDPRLVTAFWNSAPTDSLASEPLFASVRSRHFAKHQQWLFLNCQAARKFLSEQHEPVRRQMAHWRNLEDPVAGKHLDRLIELLTPFDAVFSAAKLSPGAVRCTAGFITPAP
ncbi:MAG TPA: hypothetical protein VK137_15850, partial [Planctomycetaceae bacterium]|nr:hypothetical protein [Planctomycetaceae bacterium]